MAEVTAIGIAGTRAKFIVAIKFFIMDLLLYR